MFLNELTISYSKTIAKLTNNSIIGIDDLLIELNKNITSGKQKILDLSLDCVTQSFQLYVTFDWQKDNTTVIKEKIEKFFNKQKTVLTIYSAMNTYLPQNLVLELAVVIIKNLIENYQKNLSNMSKIESKNNSKQ